MPRLTAVAGADDKNAAVQKETAAPTAAIAVVLIVGFSKIRLSGSLSFMVGCLGFGF